MLFSVKRNFIHSLIAIFILTPICLYILTFQEVSWSISLPNLFQLVMIGLAGIIVSDTVLHSLFTLVAREKYLEHYRALAYYFESQGFLGICAGGLLAGTEELFFRGVLFALFTFWFGIPSTVTIVILGVIFGLCHYIPEKKLSIFTLWATWEGCLLGSVYLWSGSLTVVIIVHVLHDIGGFTLFALQRKTGWWMGSIK